MQSTRANEVAVSAPIQFEPISLSDMGQTVLRRKYLFLAVTMAVVFFGLVYCLAATKKYEASAVLLLESQEKNLEIKAVLAEIPNDISFIPSEIQVLISRNLMGHVLDDLGVTKNPDMLGKKGAAAEPAEIPAGMTDSQKEDARNALIDRALGALSVRQIEKSRAIEVSYEGLNPEMSARIVNKLTDLYIDQQLRNSFDAIRTTNSWLSEQVEEVQKKLAESEKAVAEYRAKTGLVNSGQNKQVENDIQDLSRKLTDARSKLADAEARLLEVSNPDTLETSPTIQASPLIQKLREREADSRDELANLRGQFGSSHPKVKAAAAKVAEIDGKIKQEIDRVAEGIRRDREVAAQSVDGIEKQLASLKGDYNQSNEDSVKLAALEREVDANRKFLDTINLRWKETQSQEDTRLQAPYARVLSSAAVPDRPSRPNKKMILLVALMAGMGLGAAVSIAAEQLQPGVYNGKHLQEQTGTTSIALVPRVKLGGDTGLISCVDFPIKRQSSAFMDAIRAISIAIKLELAKDPTMKIYNFTSAAEGEGKTAVMMALARQMALEGLRVVAIDCDVRHSSLSNTFGLMQKPGVIDLLTGSAALSAALYSDPATPLKIIGAGQGREANMMAIGLEAWQNTIEGIAGQFDVVLLDSPPILALPEAKLLARIGANVFCVRWQKTPVKTINFALDTLRRSEGSVFGAVVTMVEGPIARQQSHYNESA